MNRDPGTDRTHQEHSSDKTERIEAPAEELAIVSKLGKIATNGSVKEKGSEEATVDLPEDYFDGMPSAD